MNINQQQWEKQYQAGLGYLNYPNELVVIVYHRLKARLPQPVKCLDYGFGSGNNSQFLIQQVDELYGLEISESAKQMATQRLFGHPKFDADKLVVVENQLVDEFVGQFDLVNAWHVLSYNQHDSLTAAIERIASYLKPGGFLITSLATREDISFLQGIAQETHDNDFVLSEAIASQAGCKVIIPKDAQDFEGYFSEQFSTVDIGIQARHSLKNSDQHSHYYGVFQKR